MTLTANDALAKVPLLASLDRPHLEKLAKDFTPRTFDAGSVVVRQGDDHGIGFFVIAEGTATVTVDGKTVSTLGPGDSFGSIALISDRVRTATVTAEKITVRELLNHTAGFPNPLPIRWARPEGAPRRA